MGKQQGLVRILAAAGALVASIGVWPAQPLPASVAVQTVVTIQFDNGNADQ